VQICGDAHVRNLGAYASPEGRIVFDVNDFDETCRAPWEWDVKRLAISIALVGREGGISDRVARDAVMVMPVPGAFELPLAAMALAKTRRYACVVALGCVIRGETPHFDYVASEAASGLQLAALETGVPVSFGVLTVDTREQAEERIDRAADAVRTALEMADVFSQLRAQAAGGLH